MCDFDIMERKDSNTYMTNYVRLCYVAQYENRKLLEELLHFETSKKPVYAQTLLANIELRRHLKNDDHFLINECFNNQSFAKLNLRVIYVVLRNSGLIDQPIHGWYQTPRTAINTIGNCVDLIQQKYNLIFHSGKTDFTDEEVRDLFSLFKDIAKYFEHWLRKNEGELASRYDKIESCCFDIEMRSKYREHLHLLESGLIDKNQPTLYPNIYKTDSFELSTEVTNAMRVTYVFQVVFAEIFHEYMASLMSLAEFRTKIFRNWQLYYSLPKNLKDSVYHGHLQGYENFSLNVIWKLARKNMFRNYYGNLSKDMEEILRERITIISRANACLKDTEMAESFSVLKKIAKDLEIKMNLPRGKLVAKLEYYKTCCLDDEVSKLYHESLIDLAEREQQFGTSIHFPNTERTTRYWYLPDVSVQKLLEIAPYDPVSQYVLIGYGFEEILKEVLQELLSHHVPHCLLFPKLFCAQHFKYFNAEEYLLFLESEKNGYLDFNTVLLSSVMLCLKKPEDNLFLEKIKKTKQELLNREKKELNEKELKQYFSFFKDVATSVEKILLRSTGKFYSLIEKLENLLKDGEQLKKVFANLVENAQKQHKPIWMKSKNTVQTSSLLDSKEFYELLETGSYISYENRLYLGGPSNAGKTSLACILTGDEVPNKWISTNGLQIYFGQNGIHLKDKKMIPIRKGMLCHTVHRKVISAINEMHNKDATPNPNVIKVEKKETVPTDHNVQKSISKRKLEDEKLHLKKISKKRLDKDQRRKLDHTTKITESKSDIKFDKIPPKKDNEIEGPSKSAAKNPKMYKEEEEETQMKIVEKNNPSSQISKSSSSSKTLNVLQEETLRKSILDDVRNKKYNLEIAPSDLVDFGGQKAFDMTHQLFILQEGTVLLLFDGSKDLNEPLPEYPGQIISSAVILLHWVDSVSTYCTEESGMHRIQFVATHSDRYQDNFEIRRKELVTQLAATFQKHEKKLDLCFDNLFFIDARNKDDNEIDKLKDKLVQVAFSQKSWGKKMPLLWVPLEKQIVDLKLRGTSILRIEEIQKLNKSNEDLMMDDEQLNYFLRTQHAIGKLVFFDEGELAEFVIIEPSVLVNALRSFVTDEIFFPQQDRECYNILKKLQKEGMLKKIDLMKLWNQDEFQVIFPTQGFKDFLVKILIHLDVLVKPPLDNQDVSFSEEYYIVPSMVQNRFNNDYVETYLNRSRSICMSYVFKLNMAPPCVLFRVIAAAVGIFHLKDYKKQKMIFQNVATFCFDEENEFSIIKEGNRIIVYFTNANSTRKIQQSKVASVQEWLTTVISSILEFYQLHSRGVNPLHKTNYGDPFELEYGAACQRHACFVNNEEEIMRSKAGMWKCRHDLLHEVDYLWYWDSKKFEENIKISVSEIDLSQTVLMKKPTTELFRKLSFELGTNGTRLGESLGMNNSEIENNIIVNKYNVFEETRNILDYWEKSSDSVTIAVLVKALENIGSRGLLTIAKYFSHKPVKRCRLKSVPFLLSTKEDLTDEKDWFFKLKISCDKYDMHLIIDHNLQTKYKSLSETVNQTVPVYIKSLSGTTLIVQIDRSSTILDLKHAIQDKAGIPPDQQRLIHAGRQLEDDRTLDDYHITAGAELHFCLRLRGGRSGPEQWIEVGTEQYVISQQKRGTKRKRQDIEDSSTSSEECHDSSINEDISTERLKRLSVKPNQSEFEQIYKQTNYKKRSIISVGNLHENQDLLYRFILARNLCPSDVLYILRKAMHCQLHVISKAFSWYFLRSAIKQTNLSEFFSRVNDIWPGFFCRCKEDKKGHSDICSIEPVIVIDADEYLEGLQEEVYGISVRQSADFVKRENTEDKSDTFIEESSIPTIVPTISGEKVERLFLQHTKLTLVYTSITEPGYVQLGCQAKGIIPMGEEHLPVVVCGMHTKILHGHVSFLTKMHVGSRIGMTKDKPAGRTSCETSWGTLGGFVKLRGQKAFLTCSHVMYDKSTLLKGDNIDKHNKEIKVHCYFNNNANFSDCGIVIDDVFENNHIGRTSVDAAVVLLDSNVSQIDENEIVQITDSGQNRWLQPKFLGMVSPYLNENYITHYMEKGVRKARFVGAKSGYIERDVTYEDYDKIKENFKNKHDKHGVSLKWENISEQFEKIKTMNPQPLSVSTDAHFQIKLIPKLGEMVENDPHYIRFYHQLLMENLPFEKGDSGTCIYIVDDSSEAKSKGCIGMAIADIIDSKGKKKVIVTPMKEILEALRLI